jgi:hypothetical protein
MAMTASNRKLQLFFKNGTWDTKPKGIVFVDGTSVEIDVDEAMIIREEQAEEFKPQKYKIFEDGCELLIAIRTPTDPTLLHKYRDVICHSSGYAVAHYGQFSRYLNTGKYSFVSIKVQKADPSSYLGKTLPLDGVGWFVLENSGKGAVTCGVIKLPESLQLGTPLSLNHAYTLLSERIEPDRRSHTGNIYKLVFYKESDNNWYPLEKLRKPSELDPNSFIVAKLWSKINTK